MTNKKQRRKPATSQGERMTALSGAVLQEIRQHARQSMSAEICGVLIGSFSERGTTVTGSVRGDGAAQGGAHVTFTQDAWVKIHEEKDRRYSGQAIVGWYHSHPGFGVFLSEHDLFIHRNFFSNTGSLAWVYDPHSDEEGCFGWRHGDVKRIDRFIVTSEAGPKLTITAEPSLHPLNHSEKIRLDISFWTSPKTVKRLTYLLMAIFLILLLTLAFRIRNHLDWRDRLPSRIWPLRNDNEQTIHDAYPALRYHAEGTELATWRQDYASQPKRQGDSDEH